MTKIVALWSGNKHKIKFLKSNYTKVRRSFASLRVYLDYGVFCLMKIYTHHGLGGRKKSARLAYEELIPKAIKQTLNQRSQGQLWINPASFSKCSKISQSSDKSVWTFSSTLKKNTAQNVQFFNTRSRELLNAVLGPPPPSATWIHPNISKRWSLAN